MLAKLQIKATDPRIGRDFPAPLYATDGSAALDLVACIDETISIAPGDVQLVGLGVAIHIADPEYAAILAPRSGSGHKKGLVLGNTVGLIDSDYQGEIKASVFNRSKETFTVEPGERIAQLLIVPVERPELLWVDKFNETSERGDGGFGSTGKS